jgi:sugar/nucleoside kinase (ribokinase family)
MSTTQYDFVAIGDIVTDAFIRLTDASVHCTVNKENCEICMRFGDKIPYEEVYVVPAVGNSANAAVSAARLGLKSALVSNIGDDYFGKECLDALVKSGVATDFMKTHAGRKTNYHYVLWYEDDRTILIKHEDYPYVMPDVDSPKWVYLSSLGQHSLEFHDMIEKYLAGHPEIKLAFQPGTFQMKLGKEKMAGFYKRTEIFFCNKEEAQRILGNEEEDIKKLLAEVQALGPKVVVITDGPAGAYAIKGDTAWFMPPYPDPKPPYERTGAGDAFSSTVTVALALGLDLPTALKWGPVNSMSVVQQVGAQAGLLNRAQIEEYLGKAPENYVSKEI